MVPEAPDVQRRQMGRRNPVLRDWMERAAPRPQLELILHLLMCVTQNALAGVRARAAVAVIVEALGLLKESGDPSVET